MMPLSRMCEVRKWGGEAKEAETDRGVGGTGVLLRPGTLLGGRVPPRAQ